MHYWTALIVAVALAFGLAVHLDAEPAIAEPLIGVDANYALQMQEQGAAWHGSDGRSSDVYTLLARRGFAQSRIRLWVGDEDNNRLHDATQTAARCQQAGLSPYLVLFLSDRWADFVKQPVPAAWEGLSHEEKLRTVEDYAKRVTQHFIDNQIDVQFYEIGNEIDFGICGVFEQRWSHRVNLEHMQTHIWPATAEIIVAAQRGVLAADPDARFTIHLTQWQNEAYCLAYWRHMLQAGVQIDFAGLSYFPTASEHPEQRTLAFLAGQAAKIHDALGRRVLICETGFPTSGSFGGQFAQWNQPVEGYPLTEAGQAAWLADLLEFVRHDEHLAGVYYWSPEWYGSEIWSAFALFDPQGQARPALDPAEAQHGP